MNDTQNSKPITYHRVNSKYLIPIIPRLPKKILEIIIKLAKEIFDSNIEIYIFGSRVKNDKKGGDIDILIKSPRHISLDKKLSFLAKLELNGIERKVDLLVVGPKTTLKQIHKDALETGIKVA